MKKLLTFALAGMFAMGFASCKKDYVCACNLSSGGSSTTIYKYDIKDETRHNAKNQCTDKASALGVDYTCDLE